jgi:S-DNA-T family DNA segregation ATPase FtsK/SpoIIIE
LGVLKGLIWRSDATSSQHYLSSLLTDRKLQARADNAIKTLLTQRRSTGYAVVGCCQDVRKSTVEYRDLFPIRICGGLNEGKMVDLVLGEGMHDAGAVAEQIPLGREGAGVAFVLDAERAMKPRMVRAPWCSDETIKRVLQNVPRRAVDVSQDVKDERAVPQWELDTQPLQQWQYSIE